jgi:hypothetical protein
MKHQHKTAEIKTWQQRCDQHPDHESGMISNQMIMDRMQEEIDELRQALRGPDQVLAEREA